MSTVDTASKGRQTRRTRIVCISDTHNSTVKLPKGDVLIHAGDLTNQGSYSELSKALQWLEKTDYEAKIVIAGNHDITLDQSFYSEHGHQFHNQNPQDPTKCIALFKNSPTVTYLCHESATIRLTNPKGPRTTFTIFGSPYIPRYGLWGFSYDRSEKTGSPSTTGTPEEKRTGPNASELWAAVPLDTDILVTHTPPYSHCDGDDRLGCRDLQDALSRVRPRLHVCGHIHPGRGAERVRWEVEAAEQGSHASYEATVYRWQDTSPDPRSAKMSLVDLTARRGGRPLDFCDLTSQVVTEPGGAASELPYPAQWVQSRPSRPEPGEQHVVEPGSRVDSGETEVSCPLDGSRGFAGVVQGANSSACSPQYMTDEGRTAPNDRTGRRETCIVNCAIVATRWPHTGGKQLNKPIVVDIDLPVWT